jgi:hypothetical protein
MLSTQPCHHFLVRNRLGLALFNLTVSLDGDSQRSLISHLARGFERGFKARPRLQQLADFFVSLGAAGRDVRPSLPDGRHDAQLLGNFIERGVLRESLERVEYGLLVRHVKKILPGGAKSKLVNGRVDYAKLRMGGYSERILAKLENV